MLCSSLDHALFTPPQVGPSQDSDLAMLAGLASQTPPEGPGGLLEVRHRLL